MDIIDISLPLDSGMPIWPGSSGFRLRKTLSLEAGDPCNVSQLDCDVHTGTHVDAPAHFIKSGITIEKLPLEMMVGAATVVYIQGAESITAAQLASLSLPLGIKRLLFRTDNSELWQNNGRRFTSDYVGLTCDAAEWIVNRGIQLVGIDYLSIQHYDDTPRTHEILLGAQVIILEGLNLAKVKPGEYELICLPLRLTGAEGAPARVVLRRIPGGIEINE
jgi:arylformamidase